jgi:hypothetical protein
MRMRTRMLTVALALVACTGPKRSADSAVAVMPDDAPLLGTARDWRRHYDK